MDYITMIFDLKNSRKLDNRDEIQYKLIDAIKQCNHQYSHIIQSPFLITIGDEWEGLLKPNQPYESIIEFFHHTLPDGIKFYTAVGIGSVTVHNYELTVNQLDGPSFYLAREAMEYAKLKNHDLVVLK